MACAICMELISQLADCANDLVNAVGTLARIAEAGDPGFVSQLNSVSDLHRECGQFHADLEAHRVVHRQKLVAKGG
jgi:hypothetical protein